MWDANKNLSDVCNWMHNSCDTYIINISQKIVMSHEIQFRPENWSETTKYKKAPLRKEEANVGKRKGRRKIECAATSETEADGKRERGRDKRGGGRRVDGGRELLVSQTVRKRLTPRIKWYRNETIVEQMPGHKTTASSFPFPIAALSTPVEQAN